MKIFDENDQVVVMFYVAINVWLTWFDVALRKITTPPTKTQQIRHIEFDGNKEKNQFLLCEDYHWLVNDIISDIINDIIKIKRIRENGGKISIELPSKNPNIFASIYKVIFVLINVQNFS